MTWWTGAVHLAGHCHLLCWSFPSGGGAVKESGEKAPSSGGLVKTPSRSEGTSVDELTQMMDALRVDKRDLMRKLEASQRERMLMGEN